MDSEHMARDLASNIEKENLIKKDLEISAKEVLSLIYESFILTRACLDLTFPDENRTQTKLICAKLLTRLSMDLRSIHILAERGYHQQATALAGSVYEGAFTIATIGNDEALAKKWFEHEDPKNAFQRAIDLTKSGLSQYGKDSDTYTEAFFYKIYRQFCLSKHLNPLFEKQIGILSDDGILSFSKGPNSGDQTLHGISFCAVHVAQLTLIAADVYLRFHSLPNADALYAQAFLEDLRGSMSIVYRECAAKWSSSDPFPGRW